MRILIALLTIISFGCTKSTTAPAPVSPVASVVCPIEGMVASGIASLVVSTCVCGNPAQVQMDIGTKIGGIAGLCPTAAPAGLVTSKAILGSLVCPLVIQSLTSMVPQALPAAWACTSCDAGLAPVTSALTTICEGAIPMVTK